MTYIASEMVRRSHDRYLAAGRLFVIVVEGICKHGVGVLRLEVCKALYERSGLGGKPLRNGGRKHLKTRYGR